MAVEIDWEAMEAAKMAEAQRESLVVFAKSGNRRLVRYNSGNFQILKYINDDVPMEPVSGIIPEHPGMSYHEVVHPLTFRHNTMKIEWLAPGKKYFHFSKDMRNGG